MKDMEMKQRLFDYLEKEKIKIPAEAFDGMNYIEIDRRFIKYELTIKTKPLLNLINDSYYGFYIRRTETDYIAGFILPSSGEFFTDEYDRTSDAFKLYSAIYEKKISYDVGSKTYHYKYIGDSIIEISGDIDVNFKMQKVNYYLDIVEKAPSNKNIDRGNLKKKLLLYHELTYHPDNISIMPCNGGINNLKQALGFDRIDTFLFTLKQYYENGISSYILNFGRANMAYTELRENLKNYLDSYNLDKKGIYNYCREIYHIGDDHREFIDELCEFGKKAVQYPEDVETYLGLMTRYWSIKSNYYKSANSTVQTCYQKMLKREYEIRGKKYINSFTGTMDYHC